MDSTIPGGGPNLLGSRADESTLFPLEAPQTVILVLVVVIGIPVLLFSPVATAIPLALRFLPLVGVIALFWVILAYYLTPKRVLELDRQILLDLRSKRLLLAWPEVKRIAPLGRFGGFLVVVLPERHGRKNFYLTRRQVALLRTRFPMIPVNWPKSPDG